VTRVKSILLFRLGGLGDLLVGLPAVQLLRRAFPQAKIHLVGRRDYGALLREGGAVNEAFSADDAAWTPLFGESGGLRDAGRARLAGYDLILGWFQGRPQMPLLFSGSGSAPPERARSFHYDPDSGLAVSRYFYERTAEFLRSLDASTSPFESYCRLYLPGDEPDANHSSREAALSFTVVHPGSGSAAKCWPLGRFLSIMKTMASRGGGGILVTGEAEERLEAELRPVVFPPKWGWLRRPGLLDLARRLRPGVRYLGNDSGITHLAAARGADVVAVFRKEFKAAWAPYGRSFVVSAADVADIPEERVLAAVERRLGGPAG